MMEIAGTPGILDFGVLALMRPLDYFGFQYHSFSTAAILIIIAVACVFIIASSEKC